MIEDIAAQMKIFVGLVGAFVTAALGSAARNVYAPGGFVWKRWLQDLLFAATCAVIVGGIGEAVHVAPLVVYGLAGAFGYLGPQWLDGWLRKRAEERAALKGGGDEKPQ